MDQEFKNLEVTTIDLQGKLISYKHFSPSNLIKFNMDVEAGIYLIILRDDANRLARFRVSVE